jgi:hypothetical protein
MKRRTRTFSFMNLHVVAGLRLAGAAEALPGSEFAKQNALTASEVRTLLFGHGLRGRTPFSARELGASFTTDGLVTLSGDWGPSDGSVARFDGDRLCFRWGFRSTDHCAVVFRNPGGTMAKGNVYIWYDEFGAFPFSVIE